MNVLKRYPLYAALLIAWACAPADLDRRRSALSVVIDAEREAHFNADADALAALLADTLSLVQDGQILRVARDDVRAQFEAYFAGAEYQRWDDLSPPRLTLSADGSTATVTRSVEVVRTQQRPGRSLTHESFVSSWVATYRWAQDRWQMTANASGVLDQAGAILSASASMLDRRGRLNTIQAIGFSATASGPGGDFEVDVQSARDGRVRLTFDHDASLGILPDRTWQQATPAGPTEELNPAEEQFVRGHEVLAMILWPAGRVPSLRYDGRTLYDDTAAIRLSGRDALDGVVDVFFAAADTLPLGFQVQDHRSNGAPVSVTYADWDDSQGVLLPRVVRFAQGDEVFTYLLEDIQTRSQPEPSWFTPR